LHEMMLCTDDDDRYVHKRLPDMGSTGRDRMHRPHATMHPPR